MHKPASAKLNFKLLDVMRAGIGLAMVDGGFIIAVQIISFLLNYFGTNITISETDNALVGVSKTTFLISIIGMLNLSVIIYRITGLARGMQYSPALCYQHALRRWPMLILLYMIGSMLLITVLMPMAQLLRSVVDISMSSHKLMLLSMLMLTPYGMLACIFVLDQQKNPLQAIFATLNMIKQKISLMLLLNISILYALPITINNLITTNWLVPYLGLFNAVWFLFCHLLIIVIYAGFTVSTNAENKQNPTKVIIV